MSTSRLEYEQRMEHQQEQLEHQRRMEPLERYDETDSSEASMIVEIPQSLRFAGRTSSDHENVTSLPSDNSSRANAQTDPTNSQTTTENGTGSSLYDSTPDLSESDSRSPIITRTCSADPTPESQIDVAAIPSMSSAIEPLTPPGKHYDIMRKLAMVLNPSGQALPID